MIPTALNATFLSSNAQDFIEEIPETHHDTPENTFLSSNAQDFIEEENNNTALVAFNTFLSSNAQDFIEEGLATHVRKADTIIPEQ